MGKIPKTGLSTKEAQTLLEKYGVNELTQKSKHSPIKIFLEQFKSIFVLLLLLATATSFFLGDTVEGVLIFLIIILNGILGFVQEYKAEKALAALKRMTQNSVRVIRDGSPQELDSKLLVPGDYVLVEEGDKIPADGTLALAVHLEINESALTGESMPVEKSTGDDAHVYSGTTVAKGRATLVVTHTGMQTKFGQIAATLASMQDEETPLEKKLQSIAGQLGMLALVASSIIIGLGLLHATPIVDVILTSISMAVAAVPEGLPAVITITLAVGTQRMAKQRAILRKLSAIEALGSVTVIATDKTGTLTKNEMHVVQVWMDHDSIAVGKAKTLAAHPLFTRMMNVSLLNNNASLSPRGTTDFDVVGDKTEGALLMLAAAHTKQWTTAKQRGTLLEEFAFDATTKTMSVVWEQANQTTVLSKGAPESILERSTHVATAKGEKKLTQKEKDAIIDGVAAYASQGLRVIALAEKSLAWSNQKRDTAEAGLTFLGFVGIADPPRLEVAHAISIAKRAGIQTIMITGDNELTGSAIARQVGLMDEDGEVLTGAQLDQLSDAELTMRLPHIRVFARATPHQKLRIVSALRAMGEIVAVTGDGVNDALALKQADVGVAMGKSGTDVAKEAADMVLTDDNYATLVAAIAEGRVIYDNMKASIKYLIGCNIGEVLALVGGALFGWPFILTPLHLLFINLVTDGLPAIALALSPRHPAVMERKPRKEKHIFTHHDLRWFAEVSILTAITTLIAFFIGYRVSLTLARTLAFTVIVLAQQCIFLDIAAFDRTIFSKHLLSYRWLFLPFVTFALQLVIVYVPQTASMFGITAPPTSMLLATIAITGLMILTAELRKKTAHHWFYTT